MSIKIDNLTPRAERALARAVKLSADYQHAYVGTEHLFLALLLSESVSINHSIKASGGNRHDLIERTQNNLARAAKRTDPDPDLAKEGAKALRKFADFLDGLH